MLNNIHQEFLQNPVFTYLLIVVVIILVVITLNYKFRSFLKTRKVKKRFTRGRRKENEAQAYLISNGFKILDYQKSFEHKYFVDNRQRTSELKVDYFVSKNGKKYLVEVKSGQSAISASYTSTRRQLLEYKFALPNNGILLLDMENRKIEEIKFISNEQHLSFRFFRIILVISTVGILFPYWSIKISILMVLCLVFILNPGRLSVILKWFG